jgi:protein-tyrosine-phosphatase
VSLISNRDGAPTRGRIITGFMTDESTALAGDIGGPPPIRVLFLCTGNSARSQIAEALLLKKGGARFIVASAGTTPADAVRPGAITALAKTGIDWSHARPKHLDRVASQPWDLVVTLCDQARESCPAFTGRPVTAHWGIPDPALSIDRRREKTAYDDTLALLAWCIDLMLALRPELLDKLVLAERLAALVTAHPPTGSSTPSESN